jgi:hypothetical protein
VLTYQERKQKTIDQRKRHMLRNWISSFAITTVVVVATVLSPQIAPYAIIDRVGSIDDQIYYSVTVQDPDRLLLAESLKIIISNQLENYEINLILGQNNGFIESLRRGTEYEVKVVGSRGYGAEILAKTQLTTSAEPGAAILSYQPQTPDINDPMAHFLTYDILASTYDPEGEFLSVTLRYAVVYASEYSPQMDFDSLSYTDLPMTSNLMTFVLDYIPNNNIYVVLILEAIDRSNVTVILDQVVFRTPINIEASIYVSNASYDSIEIQVYPDFSTLPGIEYRLELYKSEKLLKTVDIVEIPDSSHYGGQKIEFEHLQGETDYELVLIATYQNPDTGLMETKTLNTLTASTTPYYQLTVTVSDEGTYYQVDLSVDDPSNYIHHFQFVIYDVTNGTQMYVSQTDLSMVLDLNDQKTSSFQIQKPIGYDYLIIIQAEKILSPTVTYYATLVPDVASLVK